MKSVTLLHSVIAILLCSVVYGQGVVTVEKFYSENSSYVPTTNVQQIIHATNSRKIVVDLDILKSNLPQAEHRSRPRVGTKVYLTIPNPDGGETTFRVMHNTTMSEGLKQQFPNIRSFDIVSETNPSLHGKIDYTHLGFHAVVYDPEKGSYFIDPVYHGETELHMVYWRSDFFTNKVMSCDFTDGINPDPTHPNNGVRQFGDCQLRTYRLAICATGEYTAFHGGTQAAALSAQVTTMNRVNGIYERDMAVTLEIIPNNNLIVYTNANTDPFSNGNTGAMIGQSQTTCNGVIGAANYDIGHVFGTDSGGLAGLGVVCTNNQKARGVTGSSAPVGDPFDIDYVAHEMGHQFGCEHTQSLNNNCNSSAGSSFEPGSGSTIMAYAGICPPNVQNNSDDHFHGHSLQQMEDEIFTNACPVVTSLSNDPPFISAVPTNFYVPANTPFALTCTATDPNGNTLLYCWEQMDGQNSPQNPILPTSTNGPNYRSRTPSTNPTRYFPQLSDINAGNLQPQWEMTPSVSRAFNFRVTVRDQAPGGGCTDHADITMNTDATAGPFILTYPSANGITWNALTNETVTWNVANTTNANVNCQNVDIFLSTDGGNSYPTQLADDVPNIGSYSVSVPNTPSNACRIMVMAQNGTFFDVSDNNFIIQAATFDYTLASPVSDQSVCQGVNAQYTIDVGQIGGYSDDVTLSITGVPGAATSAFSTNPVTPGNNTTLTISSTAGVTPGVYNLTLEGNSTTGTKQIPLTLTVSAGSLSAVSLTYPVDGQSGVASPVNFTWSDAGPGATYDLEIATDAGFASVVSNQVGLTTNSYSEPSLSNSTIFYWRVTAYNSCSTAPTTASFSFETAGCSSIMSTDVPVTFNASETSTIVVSTPGTITDLNVIDLIGTHDWVPDMQISLTSPSGTTVMLFDQICNNNDDDFNMNFDDDATPGAIPCAQPAGNGGTYVPNQALSAFNGEPAAGTWTLNLIDVEPMWDDGILQSWGLQICAGVCNNAATPSLQSTMNDVCPNGLATLSIASGALNDASDWEWYSGSCGGTSVGSGTSINVNPTSTTTYYVRGEGGCTGTAASCESITVNVYSPYNGTVSETFCNGDTFTYPDGSTTNTSGTNVTVLTDQNGCDSTITTNATVIALSFSISNNAGELSSNQFNSATYQWIDCGNGNAIIPGETNRQYTPTTNGSYAVIVTSTIDGNCEVTSPCETISNVGLGENDDNSITIYPNPSDGKYIVKFTGMNLFDELEVTDGRGKVIHNQKLNGELEVNLDLTEEAKGVYIMRVKNTEDVKIVKLIKQ